MPTFINPKSLSQQLITLPQALRWLVLKEAPNSDNVGALPTFPDGDTSRETLFWYLAEGHLRLYGSDASKDGKAPYRAYEEDCEVDELGPGSIVPDESIRRAGINSVNWCHSTLGSYYIDEECENSSPPYWVNLRIQWKAFHELTTGQPLQAAAEGVQRLKEWEAKAKRGRGAPMRPDWPFLAAVTAIVREREIGSRETSSDNGLHSRVGKILDKAKYSCPDHERLPSRPNFIEKALAPVEAAIDIYEKGSREAPPRFG